MTYCSIIQAISGWHSPAAFLFPVFPTSVFLDFFYAEPLHVRLTQAEEFD